MLRQFDGKPFHALWTPACLAFALLAAAGCETRHAGSVLVPVEAETPEAQPCGDGCEEGTTCVPVLDENDVLIFECIDVHLRFCAPCMNDDDCFDPYMPEAGSLCVGWDDGSGSFCATDCSTHSDCPDGAFCQTREDGAKVCMPEGGECSCSEWAIENSSETSCSVTNANGSCQGIRACEAEGLTDCDAAIPAQEVCNGVDDNCDTLVDDVYPELNVACDGSDLDMCTDGMSVCVEGVVECMDESPEGAEACNGLDDDCNDIIDDLDPVLSDLQDGVCVGSLKECLGSDGWSEPDYTLIEKFEVGDEVTCDDLDNDCDGETDESYTEGGTVTYTDLAGATGLIKGDPCGVGACAGGSVVCAEDGESLTCSTADARVVEICDGIDNDCDGEIDEDLTPEFGDRQEGVCQGSVRTCEGSAGWVEPNYAAIEGFELDEVSCDGLDNDCDGDEDELFMPGGSITYTDADGTTGLTKGQACGAGACAGGVVVCGEDTLSLTCDTVGLIAEEICDGADNDCNGDTDEALSVPDAALQAGVCSGALQVCAGTSGWVEPAYTAIAGFEASEVSCDGLDNDCDGSVDDDLSAPLAGNQAGVCGGALKVCFGSAGWMEPVYTQIAGFESTEMTCDGQDNDCDGDVDESLMAPMADVQQGVCAGSQRVCSGAEGWVEPSYAAIAGFEAVEATCDAIDNDCDGETDELLDAPLANVQLGVCAGAIQLCEAGTWIEPTYGSLVGFELIEQACDGLDNDCDGELDEELSAPLSDLQSGVCVDSVKVCGGSNGWLEPDYTVVDGYEVEEQSCDDTDNDCDGVVDELFIEEGVITFTDANGTEGLVKGDECGAGACSGGVVTCAPDAESLTCSTWGDVEVESCDGIDNDCDGNTDEGLSAPAADVQTGVCAGATQVCGGEAGWLEPSYENIADYEAVEVSCDGRDNDCDGELDEALTAPASDLQGGVCVNSVKVCGAADGWLEPDYTVVDGYEVEEQSCDAIDNDCDGDVDELFAEGGMISFTDADGTQGLVLGDACGAGACNGGVVACSPDAQSLTCTSWGEVEAESCNGVDDDCDGTTDEALSAPAASLQAGVCAGAARVCGGVSGWLEPAYGSIAGFEGAELSCDGLDNDCDGLTDESLAAPAASLTAGVCSGALQVCTGLGGWVQPDFTAIAGYQATEITCDSLDNDCDGVTDEGYDLLGDVNNCGACGNVCNIPNGSAACVAGECVIAACDPGFDDCNNDATLPDEQKDGCEIYVVNDVDNCGSCGNECTNEHGGLMCSGGQCAPTCDSDWADCNDDFGNGYTDGCETQLGTLTDCSSCGDACNTANGYPSCDADGAGGYECGIQSCGYGYCDLYQDISGCEFPINSYSAADPDAEFAAELAACGDANTLDYGGISADEGGYLYLSGGIGEVWVKVTLAETDGTWFGTDLGALITLDPGGYTDYDLFVYEDSCGGQLYGSASYDAAVEQLSFTWSDNWIFGGDDTKDFYIFVKFYEAAPFDNGITEQSACYGWNLSVEGAPF